MRIKTLTAAAITVLAGLVTFADTEVVDGLAWSYTVGEGIASVGDGDLGPAIPQATTGAVTIPSTLGNCPVARIGNSAFKDCSGLTSVTIPEGVMEIGDSAFKGCAGLGFVSIPSSVTRVGLDAFSDCTALTSVEISFNEMVPCNIFESFRSTITNVTIREGTTCIIDSAFQGFSALKSVTIPQSVTRIGSSAFDGCGFTAVTIPSTVMDFGEGAFANCGELLSVTFSDGDDSVQRFFHRRPRVRPLQCAAFANDPRDRDLGRHVCVRILFA